MHPAVTEALRHLGEHDGTPFLRHAGILIKASWCAAFVLFCADTAVPRNHLPHSARVHTNWAAANRNRLRYEVITPRQVAWGKQIRSGDVVAFSHDPDAADWQGHTGLVIEALPGNQVRTIEGNTSCPKAPGAFNAEQERNGNCVAEKVRGVGPHSFRLMGFYRERSG